MKKFNNAEAELKKGVSYKKNLYIKNIFECYIHSGFGNKTHHLNRQFEVSDSKPSSR